MFFFQVVIPIVGLVSFGQSVVIFVVASGSIDKGAVVAAMISGIFLLINTALTVVITRILNRRSDEDRAESRPNRRTTRRELRQKGSGQTDTSTGTGDQDRLGNGQETGESTVSDITIRNRRSRGGDKRDS